MGTYTSNHLGGFLRAYGVYPKKICHKTESLWPSRRAFARLLAIEPISKAAAIAI